MIANEMEQALKIEDTQKRYEYAYDALCNYLDSEFKEKNYCDFKDDKCIVNRSGLGKNPCMGCCYSFRLDFFMNMRDKKICRHLCDKKCSTQCISCKFYTCKYLRRKGIQFYAYSIPGIEQVFTRNQIDVLTNNCFRTREEIITRLMEVRKYNRTPNFWFYLRNFAEVRKPKRSPVRTKTQPQKS